MTSDKKPSTRSLIAEAESLRSGKGSKKVPKTRQLVAESERLIGRDPGPGATRGLLLVGVVIGLLVAGAAAWFLLS